METKRQNTRLSFTQCEHCSFPTDRLQQLNSCLYTKKRRGEKAHLKCGPQPPSAFSCCWKATISPTDNRVSSEILAQLDISTIPSSLSDLSRSLFSSATTTKRKKKKKKRPHLSGNYGANLFHLHQCCYHIRVFFHECCHACQGTAHIFLIYSVVRLLREIRIRCRQLHKPHFHSQQHAASHQTFLLWV